MEPPIVLSGPSFRTLRETAFDHADAVADAGPQRILVIENNGYQRESIADQWATTYSPLRARITDISSFVLQAHERLYGPHPDIGTFERRRIIEQALATLEREDILDNARQYRDSCSELFLQFEGNGLLTPATVRDHLEQTDLAPRYVEPVATAFEAYDDYQSIIAHPVARSRNQKAAEISTADDDLDEAFPTIDAVIVSGLPDPSAVEAELLNRLAEEFELFYVLPHVQEQSAQAQQNPVIERTRETLADIGFDFEHVPPGEPGPLLPVAEQLYTPQTSTEESHENLAWHRAPTPDREVRHVARRIRRDLATGTCSPADLLVLVPGLLSYREHIADTFAAYGIERAMNLGVFLEHTYVGRAMLDAVALCEQPTATVVTELATNPVVEIPDVDPEEVADVERRLYTADIDRFRAELDKSAAGVDRLLETAANVSEDTTGAIVESFRTLLAHLGLDDPDSITVDGEHTLVAYETRAASRVQRSLDSVERVLQTCDPETPFQELKDAIEGLRIPSPRADPSGRVEIIGLQDTPMATFSRLYVLGATDEHLPGRDDRPRFFETIGTSLDLLADTENRDRARHRFATLLANADAVHITTPERTTDDEQLLESPIIDELARVTGLDPTEVTAAEPRGSVEDLQRAMGQSGASAEDLSNAVEAASNGAFGSAQTTFAQNGIDCASNRSDTGLSGHDAQLDAVPLEHLNDRLTHEPYSHNRLSSYATCGFKYLLEEGLGFDEPDSIDPGLDHRIVGSVVHDALESFFRGLQSDEEPVDLTKFDRDTLEQRLFTATQDALADNEQAVESAFDERLLAILCAGLASPAENPYYYALRSGSEQTPGRGLFVRFLDNELTTESDAKPMYFEAEFGDEQPVTAPNGSTLPVGGVIDRVDVTPDRSTATVFDYKTSRQGRIYTLEKHAAGGMDFQLPLYALAAESLLDSVADPVEAAYYQLHTKPDVKRFGKLSRRFDDGEAYEHFLEVTTPRRIDTAISAIEDGTFHPTVAGADAAQCEYCAFRDVCDVRHHRRDEIIDAIEDDNNVYVPDAARSDGWDELREWITPEEGGDTDV